MGPKPPPSSGWVLPKSIPNGDHLHTLSHLLQVGEYSAAQNLAKKAVLRLDTEVKRAFCSRCGESESSVRVKASGPHGHVVVRKCGVCGGRRKWPAPSAMVEVKEGRRRRPTPQRQRRRAAKKAEVTGTGKETCSKAPKIPPVLPPYSDRLQGSNWDTSLLSSPSPLVRLYQQASRSRGDHMILTGLSKNSIINHTP